MAEIPDKKAKIGELPVKMRNMQVMVLQFNFKLLVFFNFGC